MERVLEPEVMDTPEEARAYDAMDHREVNARFCEDLLAEGPIGPSVLDVGTGTALIPIELCARAPHVHVVAIDLAENMLARAKENLTRAGLHNRVMLEKVDAKSMPYADGAFATTVSNSIVHHIPEPRGMLAEMLRVTAPGGLVFVRDLARPRNDAEVDRLVELYGGERPADPQAQAAWEHQRGLLRASLKAALTLDEIVALASDVGMPSCIRMTSDRHWTLTFRKPR
jgi:ubiquinone/menaquinone biosynthesis C-methylase UbiE